MAGISGTRQSTSARAAQYKTCPKLMGHSQISPKIKIKQRKEVEREREGLIDIVNNAAGYGGDVEIPSKR